MNKEELLKSIKELSAQKQVSKAELLKAYSDGAGEASAEISLRRITVSMILYYLGGSIIFLGIIVLIAQNWNVLNNVTRILSTFGAGLAAFFCGYIFTGHKKYTAVGHVFYFIAALVIPVGLFVIFDISGYKAEGFGVQSIIMAIMTVVYFLTFYKLRLMTYIAFTIVSGVWLFFSFTDFLFENDLGFTEEAFYSYRYLLVGISGILLGKHFTQEKHRDKWFYILPLYGIGSIIIMIAALVLGGEPPDDNMFWVLFYPVLAFGMIFLSLYLKDKIFLPVGSLFLMIYIIKTSVLYFSGNLGWPLSLVISGLMLMLIGYMSIYFNKKYLTSQKL
ncbi:DUF2157 domain-containing protein [candidate division KSB1 bacterium]